MVDFSLVCFGRERVKALLCIYHWIPKGTFESSLDGTYSILTLPEFPHCFDFFSF